MCFGLKGAPCCAWPFRCEAQHGGQHEDMLLYTEGHLLSLSSHFLWFDRTMLSAERLANNVKNSVGTDLYGVCIYVCVVSQCWCSQFGHKWGQGTDSRGDSAQDCNDTKLFIWQTGVKGTLGCCAVVCDVMCGIVVYNEDIMYNLLQC